MNFSSLILILGSAVVHVVAHVAAVRHERRSRVYPDAEVDLARRQCVGYRLRRVDCPRSGREGEEEGISLGVHLYATLRLTRLAHDASMLGERIRVGLCAELAQKPRRSLDICEEERDCAGREVASHARGSSD